MVMTHAEGKREEPRERVGTAGGWWENAPGRASLSLEVWRARLPLSLDRQIFWPINKKRQAERKGEVSVFCKPCLYTCREERGTCGLVVAFLFFYPRNDRIGGMVGGSVLPLSERGNLSRDYSFIRHSWWH